MEMWHSQSHKLSKHWDLGGEPQQQCQNLMKKWPENSAPSNIYSMQMHVGWSMGNHQTHHIQHRFRTALQQPLASNLHGAVPRQTNHPESPRRSGREFVGWRAAGAMYHNKITRLTIHHYNSLYCTIFDKSIYIYIYNYVYIYIYVCVCVTFTFTQTVLVD